MNAEQRQSVLDNARYLRSVRPVDPEEICEYVEGQPHPAAVRQVLREHAPELGLREREDGTFAPFGDEPIRPDFRGVEALPDGYARAVEELLVERFGSGWPTGESGNRLRNRIREFKKAYHEGEQVQYDYVTALGYAIYHLPDNYAVTQYAIDDLGTEKLLPRHCRVLEVGAGVGGPALGLHDYYPEDSLVEYEAVEPSAAADVLESLLETTDPRFQTTVSRERAETFDPEGEYDLLLFANILSELDDPVAVLDGYLDHLADDGALVAIAPADLETATGLRDIERAFDGEYTVFSPTVRLWPDESPSDRGWSFRVEPDLDVPGFQKRLDDPAGSGGEFVNVDVQFAYFVLRKDDRTKVDARPNPARHAKMAEMGSHVTERVDLLALKLSEDLARGDNPLFKVSDGSEDVGVFAVLTHDTALNRALVEAPYGSPLQFENVLVLWNDDEEAYNLVVDEETIVDRI